MRVYPKGMRRPPLALALTLAVCACDTKGDAPAASSLSAPEPVTLHRPERVSTWRPEDKPASASLAAYAAAPEPSGTSGEDLTALTTQGARLFDGALGSVRAGLRPPEVPAIGAPRIVHRAGMTIDTDGRISDPAAFRAVAARDRWRQNETSLRYANGRSLDPTRVPFIVLPLGYRGARLGDLVFVEYRGRGAWSVVGDYGPRHRFGEGSSALAASLGINPDGFSGGVRSGVTYTIFPGTARGRQPNETALLAHVRDGSAVLSSTRLADSGGQTTGVPAS